jgi:hypothetical protein
MVTSAIVQSDLAGYETSFNQQQHVNFLGVVGSNIHVFELYYNNVWHHNDLTQLAGAPPAAFPGGLDSYVTSFNHQQHVNYLGIAGNDLHVFELYFDNAWHHNDLTQLTGAPPVNVLISEPHGYVTSFNHQQHVNFVGIDFHVHELYYDGAWHHNDLTQLTGAPNAGQRLNLEGDPGWVSPLTGYETSCNYQQHVNFFGVDNHVHELYYDNAWHHNDLTKLTGAPNPLVFASIDGYETFFNHQQHVNFLATVGNEVHVFELYYDHAWHYNDLTKLAGAHPADIPSPLDGYVTYFNNQQHINFQGIVGNNIVTQEIHVFELYYDHAWHSNDLTVLAGAPPVNANQNRFGLDGYVTSFNNQQHVNFIGTDLHIHELYYDGAWHHHDLTAIAI